MIFDPKYKAICFDMDGTLLDTDIDYDKLGSAEADTLISLGVPSDRINTHGSDVDMIRDGENFLRSIGKDCSYDELCALINQRKTDVEMANVGAAKAIPGSEELLRAIREKGLKIGLLTNGHRKYCETAMIQCGLMAYMDATDAFDDHPVGCQKPNPAAMESLAKKLNVRCSEILYLGDSVRDYLCARDSGAGFIGLASGRYGRERWKRYPEVKVYDSVAELIGLL